MTDPTQQKRPSTAERVAELDRLGLRCRWITDSGKQCTFQYRQWQRGKGGPYCDRHAAMAGYSLW